jgi:lipoate-protein ligase B
MAGQIASGERPATLLLLEHPPTFTTGRLGKPEHLLWDDAELARRRIEVHTTDRGGDFTYHGPGQLVGYPLLPLGKVDHRGHLPQVDYVGNLRRLEQVLIATLADFGLVGLRHQGLTGVWVKSDQAWVKLAAIGVKIDARGISRHGFALNLDPDMTNWQGIVPCGIDQYAVSSVAQQLGQPIPSAAVESSLVGHFGRTFGHQMQTVEAAVLPAA